MLINNKGVKGFSKFYLYFPMTGVSSDTQKKMVVYKKLIQQIYSDVIYIIIHLSYFIYIYLYIYIL